MRFDNKIFLVDNKRSLQGVRTLIRQRRNGALTLQGLACPRWIHLRCLPNCFLHIFGRRSARLMSVILRSHHCVSRFQGCESKHEAKFQCALYEHSGFLAEIISEPKKLFLELISESGILNSRIRPVFPKNQNCFRFFWAIVVPGRVAGSCGETRGEPEFLGRVAGKTRPKNNFVEGVVKII